MGVSLEQGLRVSEKLRATPEIREPKARRGRTIFSAHERIPLSVLFAPFLSFLAAALVRHRTGHRHLMGQALAVSGGGAQGTTAVRGFSGAAGVAALAALALAPVARRCAAVMLYGAALGGMNPCSNISLRTLPFAWRWPSSSQGRWRWRSDHRAARWILCGLALMRVWVRCRCWGSTAASLDPVGVFYALGAAVFWGCTSCSASARAPARGAFGIAGPAGGCAGWWWCRWCRHAGAALLVAHRVAHWRGCRGGVQRHPDLA